MSQELKLSDDAAENILGPAYRQIEKELSVLPTYRLKQITERVNNAPRLKRWMLKSGFFYPTISARYEVVKSILEKRHDNLNLK